jgi:GntR family transcriptional regulator
MSSALTVTPDDPTPPYEQLRRQLVDLIEGGQLVEGERLPPLRQLAGDLGLAVGTVARTYRELEVAGLVRSRRGGGTRVAASVPRPSEAERKARLTALAAAYVMKARALGATDAQVKAAVGLITSDAMPSPASPSGNPRRKTRPLGSI